MAAYPWRARYFGPILAGSEVAASPLLPPQPCPMITVGNGPSPVAGSVTSTSSGVPSKLGVRVSPAAQMRTPSLGAQARPYGAGAAAWAAATGTTAQASAASRVMRRTIGLLLRGGGARR